MIQLDDNAKITDMVALSSFLNEPASTIFYNGVITKYPSSILDIGTVLKLEKNIFLNIGDRIENLALWRNISLTSLEIKKETELIRL